MKKPQPTLEEFRARELISISESAVFEEVDGRMMATVQVLKSGRSKNRRLYPPSLVREAVDKGIFNGLQMFVNHNRQNPEPQSRNLQEMVSAIESTSWDQTSQSMNARVEFFDRNFYDYAQRAKNYMGVSINALVRGTRKVVNGETFEDITAWVKPRSVDWVTTPAAGGAILAFEDEEDEDMIDWSKITLEDLKKSRADIVQAIEAEVEQDPPKPPAPVVTMTPEEIQASIDKAVQEGIEAARKSEKEHADKLAAVAVQVRDAFAQSGLPPRVQARVMAGFEGLDEFNADAVTEAITEAKEELKSIGAGPQITGMGPTGAGSSSSDEKSFSIHESVKASFGLTKSDDPKKGD